MSHFQLEQEIQSYTRLDSSVLAQSDRDKSRLGRQGLSVSICDSPGRSRSRSNNSFLNLSRNASTSRLLNTVTTSLANTGNNAGQKQRSQSAARLTPSKLNSSRSNSPSRQLSGTSSWNTSKTGVLGDRFIPNRSTTDLEKAYHAIVLTDSNNDNCSNPNGLSSDQENDEGNDLQNRNKASNYAGDSRILSFKNKAPTADEAHVNNLKFVFSTGKQKSQQAVNTRQVSSKPEKILDAPNLADDFYLHLLDWSVNNHLAVALMNSLFVWNAGDGSITELFSKEGSDDMITAVSWIREGNILGVGDSSSCVDLWDVTKSKHLRTMRGHTDRVSVLDWNDHILASGSRSGQVFLSDVRIPNHHIATLDAHTQEVCGMQWAPEGGRVLATGSNDNLVHLWDSRNTSAPVRTLTAHLAAVKAVSWCPWQPKTLATGGGTSDRTIKFWNTSNGNLLQSVDTGSQVSSIVWNEDYKELVTGHGFSHNQLVVWKYPTMTKVADLRGHSSRVLLLLKSPDGSTVASAAGDETIRLWKIWPLQEKKLAEKKKSKGPVSLFTQQSIR